jgi:hypothetical protein
MLFKIKWAYIAFLVWGAEVRIDGQIFYRKFSDYPFEERYSVSSVPLYWEPWIKYIAKRTI